MKKITVKEVLLLLICCVCIFMAFRQDQKERTYTLVIPERLANAAFQMFNGGGDNLSVKEFKEVSAIVNQQFQTQASQFHIQDSLAAKKQPIKDTTPKPKQ